ncbi:DUF6262 family protein [Nocardia sp. NPDC050408]|uniref:DUF6262 family protein n=1 Tax=Nocardia sp. NPDC050408 TaxID=3364319 RepID=UPI0037965129
MTSSRDHRVEVLTTAAKAKSQNKTHAAEQAIRKLIKRHEPITFQAVGREAGVSHTFLYNHPELRSRIQDLRVNSQPFREAPAPAPAPDSESSLVLALTHQIKQLKQQHRHQVNELRNALAQAHGENLDLRRELIRRGWTDQHHS